MTLEINESVGNPKFSLSIWPVFGHYKTNGSVGQPKFSLLIWPAFGLDKKCNFPESIKKCRSLVGTAPVTVYNLLADEAIGYIFSDSPWADTAVSKSCFPIL